MDKSYNNYSDALKELIPKLDGKTEYVFEVLNIRDNGDGRKTYPQVNLKPVDMIIDPGTNETINIAYITGIQPTGAESNKDQQIILGKIDFDPLAAGRIKLVHPTSQPLFEYLFLMNNNQSCIEQPWHIQPEGRYRFQLLDEEGEAKRLIEKEKLVQDAKNFVHSQDENGVREIAKALNLPNYDKAGKSQLILILLKKAESEPGLIMNINENAEAQAIAFINDLLSHGLIEAKENKWVYSDSGKKFATSPPGIDAKQALYRFFNTVEGQETFKFLSELLDSI